MRIFLTFLTVILISVTANAQKVFYAEKNKGAFHVWRSGIVGKVKNNIIVWKYLLPGQKLQLMVYDYNMQLKRNIPVKVFSRGQLYAVDVVNRDSCFDLVVQYSINRKFYCDIGRFNDNGELIGPVKTLETSEIQGDPQNNINKIVQSGNTAYIGLIKAYVGIKKNCLLLQCILVDSQFKIKREKEHLLSFDISNDPVSPFYMDNYGNIIFAQSVFGQSHTTGNSLIIYKVEKDRDTLLNSVSSTGANFVQELKIEIDSAGYFISGVYQNDEKNITQKQGISDVGLFTRIVNPDLSKKTEDYFYSFGNIPGFNFQSLDDATIAIRNIIRREDSGFVISCSVTNTPRPLSQSRSNEPLFSFTDQSFYRKPDLSTATPVYSNTSTPTNTVYQGGNTSSGEVSAARAPRNDRSTKTDDSKNLLLLSVSNSNRNQWSLALANSVLSKSSSHVNFGNTMTGGNLLHVLFPNEISDSKQMLEEVIITSDGKVKSTPIISNNIHYLFQTQNGVQIDSHSIVFPCEVNGYLSFARVEVD